MCFPYGCDLFRARSSDLSGWRPKCGPFRAKNSGSIVSAYTTRLLEPFHLVREDEKRGAWLKLTGAPLVYSNNSCTSGITSFSAGTPTNYCIVNDEGLNFEGALSRFLKTLIAKLLDIVVDRRYRGTKLFIKTSTAAR